MSSSGSSSSKPNNTTNLQISSTQSVSSGSVSQLSDEALFEETLNQLGPKERAIVGKHRLRHGIDSQGIDSLIAAVEDKRQRCEKKRWSCTIAGKEILLRDAIGKIAICLQQLKVMGDAVAATNPHFGLPWAGISLILQVTIQDHQQMAALATGMSLMFDTVDRLAAYFRHLRRLAQVPLPVGGFKKTLIDLFVCVLKFIAVAIRTYESNALKKLWTALWQLSDLNDFVTECDRLAIQVEHAASICDRDVIFVDRKTAESYYINSEHWEKQLKRDIDAVKKRNDDLAEGFKDLKTKINLMKLETAEGAAYPSLADERFALCLDGTRTDLLQQITSWYNDPDAEKVFWLRGLAGTGKSTISRTVARTLYDSNRLAGSFFFRRGNGDRGNASRFFSTLAASLLEVGPTIIAQSIANAIEKQGSILHRQLQEQFDKLLAEPLAACKQLGDSGSLSEHIFVIDALDECQQLAEDLVRLLRGLELKIFITSRPSFDYTATGDHRFREIILEKFQSSSIRQDIELYMKHEFAILQRVMACKSPRDHIPPDWPGSDLPALVDIATPWFVLAATLTRFISEGNPEKVLATVLSQRITGLSSVQDIYLLILNQALSDNKDTKRNQLQDFKQIVSPVVLLAEPLDKVALADLLREDLCSIEIALQPMKSLISVPSDYEQPVEIFHLSFREFVFSNEAGDFQVDQKNVNAKIADHCLNLLLRAQILHYDILELGKGRGGTRRSDVEASKVRYSLTVAGAYACVYWIQHLVNGATETQELRDGGNVHLFLQRHFIHWAEALGWMARAYHPIKYLAALQELIHPQEGSRLSGLLTYCRQFLLRHARSINLAPLQAYSLAYHFSPSQSMNSNHIGFEVSRLFKEHPRSPTAWSALVIHLEGHRDFPKSLVFSPDGEFLASATEHDEVILWNARTGELLQKFSRMSRSRSRLVYPTFSADGKFLVSPYDDEVVVWDIHGAKLSYRFQHTSSTATTCAMSIDGHFVAAADIFRRVERCWDLRTGSTVDYSSLDKVFNFPSLESLHRLSRYSIDETSDPTESVWRTLLHVLPRVELDSETRSPDGTVSALRDLCSIRLTMNVNHETVPRDRNVSARRPRNGNGIARRPNYGQIQDYQTSWSRYGRRFEQPRPCSSHSPHTTLIAANPYIYERAELWGLTLDREAHLLYNFGHDSSVVVAGDRRSAVAELPRTRSIFVYTVETGPMTIDLPYPLSHVERILLACDGSTLAVITSHAISCCTVPYGRKWFEFRSSVQATVEDYHYGLTSTEYRRAFEKDVVGMHIVTDKKLLSRMHYAGLLEDASTFRSASLSSNGKLLALKVNRFGIHIRATQTGEHVSFMSGYNSRVISMNFSSDARTLGTGHSSGKIRFWNAKTGKLLQCFKAADFPVRSLSFSSAGMLLASLDQVRILRLWNAGNQKQLAYAEDNYLPRDTELIFEDNDELLRAGHKVYRIEQSEQGTRLTETIGIKDRWIRRNGKDMLHLPPDYEHACVAFSGDDTILIRKKSRHDESKVEKWTFRA